MDYINSGKQQGAKVHLGGERWGNEGFFIQPTIFTETNKDMRIVQEEIFGPVGVVIKFTDDDDVVRQANDTIYGLAAAMFTKNIDRALTTAQKLRAGTTWVRHSIPCSQRRVLTGTLDQLREPAAPAGAVRWLQAVRYRPRAWRVRPRAVSPPRSSNTALLLTDHRQLYRRQGCPHQPRPHPLSCFPLGRS